MFQIILIVVIFQILFFSVLIITKKNKTLADNILFIWLLFLSSHIALIYLSIEHPDIEQYRYLGFCFSIPHGIFLYLYTNSLSKLIAKFNVTLLFHFIPFIILFLVGLLISDSENTIIIVRAISLISTFTYIFLSLRCIKQYQSLIKGQYSNIDKINLDWLKHLIYGLLTFCFCGLIFGFIFSLKEIAIPFNEVFSILILISICILGYKGIRQNNILGGVFQADSIPPVSDQTEKSKQKNTYSNNGLKEENAKKIAKDLKNYMEIDKPFLNMDLSLNELATSLNTYPHYITQILNKIFNQNFYEFVNSYRTEEAKIELTNPKNDNLTILAIAYNCGFNSKSSFNRIFKQKTGLTPSEYRKTSKIS